MATERDVELFDRHWDDLLDRLFAECTRTVLFTTFAGQAALAALVVPLIR